MFVYLRNLNWYKVDESDQSMIHVPNVQIIGAESIDRTRTSGTTDKEFFWFKYPNTFEYHQSLKVTIYCSFNFKSFPFDSHHCDLTLIDIDNEHTALIFNSITLNYKNNHTKFGNGLLKMDQSCLPCDIFLERW